MKKLYISLIIGIFLIGIVYAGVTTSFSKDTIVDKETKDNLMLDGITNAIYKSTYCNEEYCEYCGQDSKGYGLGCINVPNKECTEYSKQKLNEDGTPTDEPVICLAYRTLTEKEKQDIQAIKVKTKLEEISKTIKLRDDKTKSVTPEPLSNGIYNIKEIK